MTKKTFHLRWNNHLQNLQTLFENLYNEQHLVDVTISCSDGVLYGHKLVLSACSPYFDKVFKDNPCKHPIMILRGIKQHDMQVLLEYMYMGAVDVGEQDLETLLDIATELQIKGLFQIPEETATSFSNKGQNQSKTRHSLEDSFSLTPSSPVTEISDDLRWQAELVAKPSQSSRPKDHESLNKQVVDSRRNSLEETPTSNNQQTTMVQNEDSEIEFQPIYQTHEINDASEDATNDYQDNSEEELRDYTSLENMEEGSEKTPESFNFVDCKPSDGDDATFFCNVCTRGFQNKGSYHRHMLTHAGIKPHQCTFCNQSFLRLSHLQRHIRVHTGERPYSCGQCPKQFARSDKLRQHYIIQHHSETNKMPKPRGRPRKNPDLPTSSSLNVSNLNSMYGVSINPVSISSVQSAMLM